VHHRNFENHLYYRVYTPALIKFRTWLTWSLQNIFFNTYDVTWATQPAWAWTAVEAHLAIICASAPALKVFFKQYLSVSSITGSWKESIRHRSYQLKSYKEKPNPYGTSSTASKILKTTDRATATTDVERGHIAVMHEVNIDSGSVHMDNLDDSTNFDDSLRDSKSLRSSSQQQRRKEDLAPSRQSNSGRLGTWRR
jgi:hypothetical protein